MGAESSQTTVTTILANDDGIVGDSLVAMSVNRVQRLGEGKLVGNEIRTIGFSRVDDSIPYVFEEQTCCLGRFLIVWQGMFCFIFITLEVIFSQTCIVVGSFLCSCMVSFQPYTTRICSYSSSGGTGTSGGSPVVKCWAGSNQDYIGRIRLSFIRCIFTLTFICENSTLLDLMVFFKRPTSRVVSLLRLTYEPFPFIARVHSSHSPTTVLGQSEQLVIIKKYS